MSQKWSDICAQKSKVFAKLCANSFNLKLSFILVDCSLLLCEDSELGIYNAGYENCLVVCTKA